jgi:hypothetical protein
MGIVVATAPETVRAAGARMASLGGWLADCLGVMADYHAAAARYEDLARLADAELERRGLCRATLARDVLAACGR